MARKKRRRKYRNPTAKARERLHALRMKFKPGYKQAYMRGLGFTEGEIRNILNPPKTFGKLFKF